MLVMFAGVTIWFTGCHGPWLPDWKPWAEDGGSGPFVPPLASWQARVGKSIFLGEVFFMFCCLKVGAMQNVGFWRISGFEKTICSNVLTYYCYRSGRKHAMTSNNLSSTGGLGLNLPENLQLSWKHQSVNFWMWVFSQHIPQCLGSPCCNFSRWCAGQTLGIHVIRYQGGDYIAQGLALRDRIGHYPSCVQSKCSLIYLCVSCVIGSGNNYMAIKWFTYVYSVHHHTYCI